MRVPSAFPCLLGSCTEGFWGLLRNPHRFFKEQRLRRRLARGLAID
jgi:hypothetical protein